MNNDFEKKLSHYRARVNATLRHAIASEYTSVFLRDAMLYSSLDAGKRLRPLLVYFVHACFSPSDTAVDLLAAAIECIHCYSLIHDDLPAMDDDTLRRGKKTCHIAFDEATAILAGDALQALAFQLLAAPQHPTITPLLQLKILQTLAHCAGASGMVGGQSLDLLAEGETLSATTLMHIHQLKTGALIRASVKIGALGAGCVDEKILDTLDHFASRLGLAFQLQDDWLDIMGNSQHLGKHTGQDSRLHKATYATLFGIEATQNRIASLMDEAMALLETLPCNTDTLKQLCDYLMKREA